MIFPKFFAASGLLISTQLLDICNACNPQRRQDGSSPLVLGSDSPADPATVGYTMNHFSLIVNDLNATKHFYGEVLGMRHIFTYSASDRYDICYMGYSHGGKNGTGFQTGEELFKEKANIEGLIEFLYLKNSTVQVPATTKALNTFSHVGLVVPDIMEAQTRMETFGVPILKAVGAGIDPDSQLVQAYGVGQVQSDGEKESIAASLNALGFSFFLLVADPDGNLVEIQPQT